MARARSGFLIAALAAAAVLPATTQAAVPSSGTVSATQPTTAWTGALTAGYVTYAAWVLADVAGSVGTVPCVAPSCDSYSLRVSGGPLDVTIAARSLQGGVTSIRVTGPDGWVTYELGSEATTLVLPNAASGTYRVDITTSVIDASTYSATATATAPAGPRPGTGPRAYGAFTYEKVRIPMRDGVELSAEIWRPVVPAGAKVPVVLHLTPYHALELTPHTATSLPLVDGTELVKKGYAFVFADVRGTWASGGCWDYGGFNERHDGYDIVEWLAARKWSNRRVAMMGVSYPGTTPNAAAVERPPHLAAIVPISGISRWWGYAYQQGARATTSGENLDIDPPGDTPTDFMFAYGFLPPPDPAALLAADQTAMRWGLCDRVTKALAGYDTDPDYTDFWKERDYLRLASRVRTPVLLSHGLQDFNVKTWEGTAWWQAVQSPKVLVLGQWPHAYPGTYYEGWQGLLERFMAHWLYRVDNGLETEKRVHVQSSDGVWHDQDDWGTPATTTVRTLGLGIATPFTYFDDGLLTESEVLRDIGGGTRWVRVPVPATDGPLRVEGRPVLRLRATSDQPSTHFTAVLLDVAPDGSFELVSRAFMNGRYRGGLERGQDLVPGQEDLFPLEFIDKDWVVASGHHLELRIASSSTTWVAPDLRRATNTLNLAASTLELPVHAAG